MNWEKGSKLIILIVVAAAFLWMLATSDIKGQVLGVVFLALVIWSLFPQRHFESSIIIIVVLSFLQVSLSIEEFLGSLLSTYGGSGIWIIVSGFIFAKAMEESGLARRIALLVVTSLRGNPANIIISVAVANIIIAPLSPSTTAKAFLLLPICVSLIEAFNVEKGQSNYGTAVMLMAMTANNICSTAFLTATVPNPISASYLKESLRLELDWINWFIMAFPITLLLLAITLAICLRMYWPEVRSTEDSLRRLRAIRESLGPIDRGEQIVAFFFVIALFIWITESFHSLNAGLVSLILVLLLFLPRIGVMKLGGFAGNVPWGSIALFAASMFLARAVGRWRALDPVALSVFRLLNLTDIQPALFVFLVVLVSMFLHVVFTSTTVYATLMVPLALSLTQFQGLNAGLVALPIAFLTPVAVILPVNTIPNLVFHSSGYFTERQMIIYGLVASLVSVILTLLVGLPYWTILGLV